MKKTLVIFICTLMLLTSTACKKEQPPSAVANPAFDVFADSLVAFFIPDDSSVDFSLGKPEEFGINPTALDIRISSLQQAQEAAKKAEEKLVLLKEFSYSSLNASQQITYDFIKHSLEAEIAAPEYYYLAYGELGTYLGFNCDLPYVLIAWPLTSKDALERMISCIEDLPESFQTYLDYEKIRTENGYVLTKETYEGIIKQANDIVKDGNDLFLIKQLPTRVNEISGLSKADAEAYKQRIVKALKNKLLPAYKLIADQLPQLLVKAADREKSGLAYFPKGKEYYEYLLLYKLGITDSPDAIFDYLKKELNEQFKLLASIVRAHQNDEFEAEYFPNADVEQMILFLSNKYKADFPAIREPEHTVEMIDKSLQDSFSPAAYFLPPMDIEYKNMIVVNPKDPRFDLILTVAHETYPGHLYNFNYLKQTDLPMLRKVISYNGTVEGWAKYADHYAANYVDAPDWIVDVNIVWDDIISTLWAMSDVGVNYKGWSYTENRDFWVKNHSWLSAAEIDGFIDNVFNNVQENPTNVLMYYYTCYQIRDYREQFKKQLGGKYTDKLFHQAVMDAGPVPLFLLKKHLLYEANKLK